MRYSVLAVVGLIVGSVGTAMAQVQPPYPVQGTNCTGINLGTIDFNNGSVACPGSAATPLRPFGECFFVDNSSSTVYFIPLRSQSEWQAFKVSVLAGLLNGVSLRDCAAPPPPKVDGVCGPAHQRATNEQPPNKDLCSAGTASSITTTDLGWDWRCIGQDGGSTASCTAPKAKGTCYAHITFQIDSCPAADTGCVTYHSFERTLKVDSAYGCVEALISSHNYWEFFGLYPWNDKAAALGCTPMNSFAFPYALVDGNGSPPNSRACYVGPTVPGENIAPYTVGSCSAGGQQGLLVGVGQAMMVIYRPATCPPGVTPPACAGGFKADYSLPGDQYMTTPAKCID